MEESARVTMARGDWTFGVKDLLAKWKFRWVKEKRMWLRDPPLDDDHIAILKKKIPVAEAEIRNVRKEWV